MSKFWEFKFHKEKEVWVDNQGPRPGAHVLGGGPRLWTWTEKDYTGKFLTVSDTNTGVVESKETRLTFLLSLMDPLPRMAILVWVASWSCCRELPFGPSSLPTKLNCEREEKEMKKTSSTVPNYRGMSVQK